MRRLAIEEGDEAVRMGSARIAIALCCWKAGLLAAAHEAVDGLCYPSAIREVQRQPWYQGVPERDEDSISAIQPPG